MDNPTVRQEDDTLRGHWVALVMAIAIAFSVALVFLAVLVLAWREQLDRPSGRFPERALGPPRERLGVEAAPFRERAEGPALQARQRAVLGSWGWVDRPRGLIHVPIDTAIDLWLERNR